MTGLVLGLLACQTGEALDSVGADCPLTWDGWADGFFTTYCRTCHSEESSERHEAPVGVDLESAEDVLDWADRIYERVLLDETMPVGGGVPQEDLERLSIYLSCLGVP